MFQHLKFSLVWWLMILHDLRKQNAWTEMRLIEAVRAILPSDKLSEPSLVRRI